MNGLVLQRGDTALHVAVRGRSKRITELLLRHPKDGRLLYRPNKAGETPYQIDLKHEKSVLTQVFGTRELQRVSQHRCLVHVSHAKSVLIQVFIAFENES